MEITAQIVEFEYNGIKFKYEFTPEDSDYWTAFGDGEYSFDVHYLEDEDNDIVVYRVINGDTDTSKAIHQQKIKGG